jgi:multidrug efflux pump subunit AcrA (membrane-fusion protein)
VQRGTLEDRVILTGELEATSSEKLVVPRTDVWLLTLRWLADDGTVVKQGDKLVEFDPSNLVGNVEEKRLNVIRAENDVTSAEAQVAADRADKTLQEEQARAALEKATIDAQKPEELLSRKEYQTNQQTLAQAQDALAQATAAKSAAQRAAQFDRTTKEVALQRAQRELSELEKRLEALTLLAPRDGVFQIEKGDQGRKYIAGDQVWALAVIATLPEPGAVQVRARLSDVDDGAVKAGMATDCILDAYPAKTWKGQVLSVSPVAIRSEGKDSQRRSFEVLVTLDKAATEIMRPGMSVRVEVLRRRAVDALIVPRIALTSWPGKTEVYLKSGAIKHITVDFCSELACVVQGEILDGIELLPRMPLQKESP